MMKTKIKIAAALGSVLVLAPLSPLFAQQNGSYMPEKSSPGLPTHEAENCVVKTIRNIRVPAEADGRITEMLVTEGMNVKAGDELAVLEDTTARLQVEMKRAEEREAELNAMSDVNLRDARNSADSAKAEAEAYKELRKNGATPHWEVEKKILEALRAVLRIELAEQQQDIAKVQFIGKRTEVALAENELKKRRIVAPFDGFIETRIAQLGEWVQPGTPVLQLVQLDTLRVEGDIDALQYAGQITVGTPATVYIYAYSRRYTEHEDSKSVTGGQSGYPESMFTRTVGTAADNGDGEQRSKAKQSKVTTARAQAIKIEGKIGFVSSEIDLSNRYRIWVEVKNERRGNDWVIKPGMEADIVVHPAPQVN